MSIEDVVKKEFCFDQHLKLTKDLHDLELKMTEARLKIEQDLTGRMITLETKFNEELADRIEEAQSKQTWMVVAVSAIFGIVASIVIKIMFP